jgi:hypothetical protein
MHTLAFYRVPGVRKDLDYIKGMLRVFLDSETPLISINDLASAGYDISTDVGIFHYMLLIEQGFISDAGLCSSNLGSLGLIQTLDGMEVYDADIRLTASGTEFASTLDNKDVFEKLKEFSNEPISVMKDVGAELLKAYLKKKLGLSD